MKQIVLSACALLVLSATAMPTMAATPSVVVNITGSVTPTACQAQVSGGGEIAYGMISQESLSDTAYDVLPEKTVKLGITCDALTKVGFTAVNNRIDTLGGAKESGPMHAGVAPIPLLGAARAAVGLGKAANGKPIGGYTLVMKNVTFDGKAGKVINDLGKNFQSWTDMAGADGFYNSNVTTNLSVAESGTMTPAIFKTLTADLAVQAYLNKRGDLDLAQAIDLDGQTTIEMTYL